MGLFSRKRAITTTENDEYNFDSDEFNFDSVSSDIEQSTSPDISNTSSRNPVMKAVRGAGAAVKDQVTSPEFIKQKVLKALPPDAVYITDAVDKVASGTRKLYDDSVKELKPSVGALTKKINKLVPQNTPFVKKLTEGVDKIFNGEQFSTVSTSKEEAENQQIESVLGGIFTAQASAQEEIRVRQRAYDESKEQIKDHIESKRFDANIDVMTSISTNISKIESYNSTIQQAYQRKSLELQYRAYFLQVDQYKDQIRANELSKANSEAIVKNTALPEFVKIKASEKFKDTMRNKFYDNLSNSSLFTAPGDFIKQGFDRIGKKLANTVTDIKSGIEASTTLLEMLQSSVESEEEMSKMGFGSSNGMTGQIAGMVVSKLFDVTANLAAEHGKESLDKHKKFQDRLAQAISKAKDPRSGILDFLNSDYVRDLREDNSKDGTIQKIGLTQLEKVAKEFTDAKTIDTTLQTKRGGVADLKEPAVFDNRTYRTINDIIPGYLSRMVFELQYANTKGFTLDEQSNTDKEINFLDKKLEYDFKGGRFISKLDHKTKINKKIHQINESSESSYAQGAEEIAIEFLGGGSFGKDQLEQLKRTPEDYKQFMLDINNSVLGNAGSNSMQGIRDSGALSTAGQKFKDIYESRLKQFKEDRGSESKLMDTIISAKNRISLPMAQLQDLIYGYGEDNVVEILEARKMASRNDENNDVTFDIKEHMQRLNIAAGGSEDKQLTNTHRTTNFNEVRLDKQLEEIIKELPSKLAAPRTTGVMASIRRDYDHAVEIRAQVNRLSGEKQKKDFIDWYNAPGSIKNKKKQEFRILTDKIDEITGTISEKSSDASKAKYNAKIAAKAEADRAAAAASAAGSAPGAAGLAGAGLGSPPAPTPPDSGPPTPPSIIGGVLADSKAIKALFKTKLSQSAQNSRDNKTKINALVSRAEGFNADQKTELQTKLSTVNGISLTDLTEILQKIKPESDVGKKRNIRSIDYGNKFTGYNASNTSPNGSSPLNTVSSLESKIWNYNPNRSTNDPNVDHVGPMAQDMQKAGGNKLAPGGTSVDLVSANGLNMAAIKEMNEKFDGAFNLLFRNLFAYNEAIIGGVNKTNITLSELLNKEVSVNIKEDGKSVNINEAILANIKRSNKLLAVMAHQGRVTSTASAVSLNQAGIDFKDSGKGFAKSIKQVVGGTFDLTTMAGSAAVKGTITTLRVAKDNVVIPLYNNAIKLAESLKEPLKKGIKKAGELAWEGIGKAKDITQDLVTNKIPTALNWMADKATKAKDKVVNAIKFRTNLLNEKGEVVFYKELLQAGQYIREDTQEVVKKLSDLKGTIIVKGSNIRITAGDYLGRLYDESRKKVELYGSKAWEYAKKGVGRAWDVASNLGEHTADFLKNTWKGDNFLGKTIHAGAGVISRALGGMGIGLGGGMGSRPIYNVLLDIRDLLRKGNRKIPMRSDVDEKNMEAKDAKHALNVEEVSRGIRDAWENKVTNTEWYKNLSDEGKALAKKQYEEKLAMVKGFSAEQLEAFKSTDNEIKEGDGFFRRLVKHTRGRMVTGVNLGESLFDKTKELADKFTQAKPSIDPESKGLQQTSDVEVEVKNNVGTVEKEHGDVDGFHIKMFRKDSDKNLWYVPPVHAIKLGAKKDMWITGSYKGILKLFKEYKALDDKKKEHEKLAGKPLTELHTVKGVKSVFGAIKNWYNGFDKAKTDEQSKAENSEYADTDQLKKDSITEVNKNGKSVIIGFKKADIEETIYKKVIGDVTLEYRKIKGSKNVHLAESEVAKILPFITDEKIKKHLLDNKEKGCAVNLDELIILIKNFKKDSTESAKANTATPTVELPKTMQTEQPVAKTEEAKSTTVEPSLSREKELKDLKKELDSIEPKVLRYGTNYLDDDLELTPEQSVLLGLNKSSHYIKRKKFNELIGRYDKEISSISKVNEDFIKTTTRNKNKEDIVSAKARKEELLKSKESVLKDTSDISNIKSLKEKPKDDDWVELSPDQRTTLGLDQSINGLRNKELEAKKEEMIKLSSAKINIFDNAVKSVDEELKEKIKEEAKALKEENKKKKDGGLLGRFLSHIPGLNLFGKKAAFNDKDGDGDRDGNAEDMSKQSKEIRDAQKKRGLLSTIFGLGKKEEKESKDEGGFFSGLLGGFGSLGVLFRAIKFIAPAAAIAATAFGSMGGAMQALNPNASAEEASDWKWDAAKTALGMYAGSKIMGGIFGAGKSLIGIGKTTGKAGAGIFSRMSGAAGAARGALAAASGGSKVAKTIGVTRAILGALTGVSLTGLVSGTASIIGGIVSSPILVPALVGAAVIGGAVYGYKKWKKDSDLWKVRFAQYGFVENGQDNQYFDKLHKLEQWIVNNNFIETKNNTVTFTNLPTKDLLTLMEINQNSDSEVNNFISWFVNRFKPFFLNFHTLLLKNKIDNPDDVFKAEDAVMQSILRDMTYANGPYTTTSSPFPTKPSCENTLEHVKGLIEYTINSLRKKKALGKLDLIDYYKLNQQSKSLEDIKNASLNKRQQEQQSVKDRLREKQEQAKRRLDEIGFSQKYRDEYNATAGGVGDDREEEIAPVDTDKSEKDSGNYSVNKAYGDGYEFRNNPKLQDEGRTAIILKAGRPETNITRLNSEFQKNLFAMVREYYQYTGKKINMDNGFRTEAENTELKGAKRSLHMVGLAADISSADANKLDKLGLMRKYGFTRPIQGEPWHIEPAGIQPLMSDNNIDKVRDMATNNPDAIINEIRNGLGKGGGGLASITPYEMKPATRSWKVASRFMDSSTESTVRNNIIDSKKVVDQIDKGAEQSKANIGYQDSSITLGGNTTKPGVSEASARYENDSSKQFVLNDKQKAVASLIDEESEKHGLDASSLKAKAFIESSLGNLNEKNDSEKRADVMYDRPIGLYQILPSNVAVLMRNQKALLESYGIDTTKKPHEINLHDNKINFAFGQAYAAETQKRIDKLAPGLKKTPGLDYILHMLDWGSSSRLLKNINDQKLDLKVNTFLNSSNINNSNKPFFTKKDGSWLTLGELLSSTDRHMANIVGKLGGKTPTTMVADASKPAATASMAVPQTAVFAPATPTRPSTDTRTHLGIGSTVNLRANDSADKATVPTPATTQTTTEQEQTAATLTPIAPLAKQITNVPKQFASEAEIDKAIKTKNNSQVSQAEKVIQPGFMPTSTNQTTYSPPVSEISVVTDTLVASHSVHVDNLGVNKQILATLMKLVEIYSKPASTELEKILPKIEEQNKKEALDNTPRRPQSLRDNNNPAPIKLQRVYT